MVTEVNEVNFRQSLGEILDQVPRMQNRFDELSGQVSEAYSRIPMEEGLAKIDALVAEERAR